MASKKQTTFDSIVSSTSRLKYTDAEIKHMSGLLHKFTAQRLDLEYHPSTINEFGDLAAEGIFVLRSEVLDADFAFLKTNAGRGLFGGQKHRIQAYVGQLLEDRFTPTTSFKNLLIALSTVRGIYRTQGLLR